jgi:hypothetical protein
MLGLGAATRIYVATGATDMRLGCPAPSTMAFPGRVRLSCATLKTWCKDRADHKLLASTKGQAD